MRKELKFEKEEESFLNDIKEIRDDPRAVTLYIVEHEGSYFPMIPNGDHKVRLLKKIYSNSFLSDPDKGHHKVAVTDKEIEFLKGLPDDLIKRLFYSLIVRSKVKPHPTGWISMDFENTIFYALPEKEARNAKIEIFSQCTEYGLETLVIGSTRPILCFKLPIEGDGVVLLEFEDGKAREMFPEVMKLDSTRK